MTRKIGILLAVSMLASVWTTGCSKQWNVSLKNSLPQEFSAYDESGDISSTITVKNVNIEINENKITVDVTEECTYVNEKYAENDILNSPSIDIRLLNEDGDVVASQLGHVHLTLTQGQDVSEDFSFSVSDPGEYTVELYDD